MSRQFEKWWIENHDPFSVYKEQAEKIWEAAVESTKIKNCQDVDDFYRGADPVERQFGCYFRTVNNFDKPWSDCSLDYCPSNDFKCDHARDNEIKTKSFCEYWKEII